MKLLPLLILLFTFELYATDTATEFEAIKENYLKTDNIWITLFKNKKETLELKSRAHELELKLNSYKKATNRAEITILQRELLLIREKLALRQDINKRLNSAIELPLKNFENINYNFYAYLFRGPEKKIDNLHGRVNKLKTEFRRADSYFAEVLNKVNALNENNISSTLKNQIAAFKTEVNDDKQFFEISGDLLSEQYNTINAFANLIEQKRDNYVNEDLPQTLLGFSVFMVLAIALLASRRIIQRTIKDEDRQFAYKSTTNLIIFALFVLFTLAFYIENIFYAATLLGLVGAGLMIASKELILNFAAWLYLLITGFIRVGDRIKYIDQGRPFIGDVIGISPSRITMYESINHTTLYEMKRAGRILSMPTHFVYTHSIFNYTHEDMKTILDLMEFDLEMGSDFKLAEKIAYDICIKNTDKYIDLAMKQYYSLKRKYETRNFNPKPQIQCLLNNDKHCMTVHIWYVAPYRDILNIRSFLTLKILKAYETESTVHLVLPPK